MRGAWRSRPDASGIQLRKPHSFVSVTPALGCQRPATGSNDISQKPFLGFFMTETCLTLLPLPTPTTDDPRSQVRARPRKHAALTILYPRSPSSALRTSAKPAGLKTVACPAQSGAKPAGLKTVACPAQSGAHCNQPSVPASHRHAQPRTTGCPTEALLKEAERAAATSEQRQQQRAAATAATAARSSSSEQRAAISSNSEQRATAAGSSSSSEQQQRSQRQ